MAQRKKHKICLVGECLSDGGAEKVQAVLSDYFTNNGIEVHHVIFLSRINYTFSGRLLNLGEYEGSIRLIRNFKKFIAFRRYVKKHRFTAIIDSRVKHSLFQELMIQMFIYSKKTFFVVHSSNIDYYFPRSKWLANRLYHKGKRVFSVSNGISRIIREKYNWGHIRTIHNPINPEIIKMYANGRIPLDYEYVLFAGRIDTVKQVGELINTYAASCLQKNGIKLVLLGNGRLLDKVKKQVVNMGLADDVVFEGFQSNPFSYMKSAKFLVLCSQFEGFGNVLVESLACGTPVVSFDCESGPREIINHEKNGLLVKNQDFEALKVAMDRMVEDEPLYSKCKDTAQSSVKRFNVETIGEKWFKIIGIKRDKK